MPAKKAMYHFFPPVWSEMAPSTGARMAMIKRAIEEVYAQAAVAFASLSPAPVARER